MIKILVVNMISRLMMMVMFLVMIMRMTVATIMVECICKHLKMRDHVAKTNLYLYCKCMCICWHLKVRDHVAKTNSACMRTNWNAELGSHQVDSQDLVIIIIIIIPTLDVIIGNMQSRTHQLVW